MRSRRSGLRAAIAALAIAATAAGCTKVDTGGENGRKNSFTVPHVLRFAYDTDVTGLNPHIATTQSLGYLSEMTMAYLIRYDRHDLPMPELATEVPSQKNGDISADGKTIVWHLRQGVKWSDGVPFSADDVVWTVGAILNKANNEVGIDGWDKIDRVERKDDHTVVFHMKTSYSAIFPLFFGSAGANPCVLPKHLLASLPNFNNAPYNSLPVGIGPFRYTKWVRGDRVEMEANPYYWRGRPKLDKIVFRIIPDRNTLLTQVQSGSIDLWPQIPPAFSERVTGLPAYTIFKRPSFTYDHFDFNNAHPIPSDPIVRQALRLATDRQTLAVKVGHHAVIVQESVIPKASPEYEDIPVVAYDPAKARAMLDADGWKVGADGIRVKGGVRLSLDVAAAAGTPDIDTRIELIRGWWKSVGAEINVKHYANAQLFAPYTEGGILYGGKFDVIFFAWSADSAGEVSGQYQFSQIPPAGQNMSRYKNLALDPAFDAYKSSFDPAVRARAEKQIQETIAHDAPIVVYDSRIDTYVANNDLKGYDPNNGSPFDDMMNVDI